MKCLVFCFSIIVVSIVDIYNAAGAMNFAKFILIRCSGNSGKNYSSITKPTIFKYKIVDFDM